MDKVKLTRKQQVSTITLNRPDHFNALDLEMIESLATIVKDVSQNDDRILIITGAGKAFCAGGDVKMMQTLDQDSFSELMDTLTEISTTLYGMPKMVISAINGAAVGLGLSLALASDFIVAKKDAHLGMLFAGLALIPDGGGHYFLKERMGIHQAKQFIWSMDQVKGEQAKTLGLIDYIAEEDIEKSANQLADELLQLPFQAIIQSKMIYYAAQKHELIQYLQQEKTGQLEVAQTENHQEGVAAFIEKRKPNFNKM